MTFYEKYDPDMLEGTKHPFHSVIEAFEYLDLLTEEERNDLFAEIERALQEQNELANL